MMIVRNAFWSASVTSLQSESALLPVAALLLSRRVGTYDIHLSSMPSIVGDDSDFALTGVAEYPP